MHYAERYDANPLLHVLGDPICKHADCMAPMHDIAGPHAIHFSSMPCTQETSCSYTGTVSILPLRAEVFALPTHRSASAVTRHATKWLRALVRASFRPTPCSSVRHPRSIPRSPLPGLCSKHQPQRSCRYDTCIDRARLANGAKTRSGHEMLAWR